MPRDSHYRSRVEVEFFCVVCRGKGTRTRIDKVCCSPACRKERSRMQTALKAKGHVVKRDPAAVAQS